MFNWLRKKLFPNGDPLSVNDRIEAQNAEIRKDIKRKRVSAMARILAQQKPEAIKYEVKAPDLFPNVLPPKANRPAEYMALDSDFCNSLYAYANTSNCGQGFIGYPRLAEMAQISEYRSPSETIATEMTRKWIRLVSNGDTDNAEKLKVIEAEMKRHCVRSVFELAAKHDGFFGHGQIYIEIKGISDDSKKLPLILAAATIPKGSFLGLKNVEPLWTTPYAYNSDDPLRSDFYKPTQWYVLGKQVHASRLMSIISRPVSDLLKPAYNFGGQSLTQLMEPYVNMWLTTRKSVSDLLHNFSITALKTDLSSVLEEGSGEDLFTRIDFFNQTRDNRGLMALQNGPPGEGEEIVQLNTPLSGLAELQAQSQEHMSAPSHIPLVKLFGITPTGLNANSDGEIEVFYDFILASQESNFREPLKTVIDVIQLDQWGAIDPAITFEFVPLMQLDGTELAAVRKSDAEAAVSLIGAGVISVEEERDRLAADVNSGYNSLQPEELPEVKEDATVLDEVDE